MFANGSDEICDAVRLALDLDDDTALVVGDVSYQTQPGRGPVNERAEPDALHDPLDPDEPADRHDGACAQLSAVHAG